MKLLEKNIQRIVIILLITIYILLAFKKIYSSDSLIPNLEPYPDSLYYSVPAWNFVHGDRFEMKTQKTILKQETPPLYGIYLVPFFALSNDPRSFYFANMLLAIGSIIIFTRTTRKIFGGEDVYGGFLTFFLGFFLVTNFYFYTIPQLLMAEPITLFLIVLGIFLLVADITLPIILLASQLGVLLILVKFSNIPLALIFSCLYLLRLWQNKKTKGSLRLYLFGVGIGCLYFLAYIFGSKILIGHKNSGADFQFGLFRSGISYYVNILLGRAGAYYLWYPEKFIPSTVAILSVLGVLVGIFAKEYRRTTLSLVGLIGSVLIFMSFFVYKDIRYIFAILPAYIILSGFFVQKVAQKTNKNYAIALMLVVIVLSLFVKSQGYRENEAAVLSFKKQVGLNLRHREVPWNYEAVQIFNSFSKNMDPEKTYIGTYLPPPYIDLFSNKKYKTLPLSATQEFYWLDEPLVKNVIGEDLVGQYKKLLRGGNSVYVTRYYQSNRPEQWPLQYDSLTSNFAVKKVYSGCLGACDIYQLALVFK